MSYIIIIIIIITFIPRFLYSGFVLKFIKKQNYTVNYYKEFFRHQLGK
jgi:hypothetical protein